LFSKRLLIKDGMIASDHATTKPVGDLPHKQ